MSLKPWREVVNPHPDVAAGTFKQAEFAADLAQVVSGKAAVEYQDPSEFFARTYLTDGIKTLLSSTAERLSGQGGEPVVQLKTAFGGGKTHTMLALYHLFSGRQSFDKLPGIRELLGQTKPAKPIQARCAVLVGTALDPTRPRKVKGKNIEIRTLWGELAYQLGGTDGFRYVEKADQSGVSPGADTIEELLNEFGPCLILIDELVAYARNIYGVAGLPSGTFDSNMTFVQALTEAIKRSRNSIVVASIPESAIEVGGQGGEAALERIENTFGRLEAVWKPVGALEGFEIVRRRLFSPQLTDVEAVDTTCRAFSKLYSSSDPGDFPSECREGSYQERLKSAYPIHPEIFDRLYGDWAALETFQKTRGVLRLMATVIHELWVGNDRSPLIVPGTLPIHAPRVRDELTRYLPEGWNAVVDSDVDGSNSEPRRIDDANPRLGKYVAGRRVARSIFLGSAPSVKQQNVRGVEDVRIRLGVVLPNEQIAVFNDALGRLSDRLTHLYTGNKRFWFDTQPNLKRTVEDRASQLDSAEVHLEIDRRLKMIRDRADFSGVHVCPSTPADVPDEQEVRLVVLPISAGHKNGRNDTPGVKFASQILESRGTLPRQFKNMLLFVAAHLDYIAPLEQEVRRYLAWNSVVSDSDMLNLDTHQREQANQNRDRTDETVTIRLQEAYCWLLVPCQESAGELTWEKTRINGGTENFVTRAARKLKSAEQLITKWSPAVLRMELDRCLWKDTLCINTKKLWEYLSTYNYLPRLRNIEVLIDTIRDGISHEDFFGYASSVSKDGKYLGLQIGVANPSVTIDGNSVLLKPEIAKQQLTSVEIQNVSKSVGTGPQGSSQVASSIAGHEIKRPARFFGTIELDPTRIGRDAGKVAEEVVQHLASLMGGSVKVTLEVEADLPSNVSDTVIRTVAENCKTLKFQRCEFEAETETVDYGKKTA